MLHFASGTLTVENLDIANGFQVSSGTDIGYAGCLRGMQCGRSALAVGEATTSAVVTSIILIVVSDSIITFLLYR